MVFLYMALIEKMKKPQDDDFSGGDSRLKVCGRAL